MEVHRNIHSSLEEDNSNVLSKFLKVLMKCIMNIPLALLCTVTWYWGILPEYLI